MQVELQENVPVLPCYIFGGEKVSQAERKYLQTFDPWPVRLVKCFAPSTSVISFPLFEDNFTSFPFCIAAKIA